MGALVVLAIAGWGTLALAVVGPGGDQGRLVLAAVYGLAGLAAVTALVPAPAADQVPDFSRRIRAGLPGLAGR